MFSLSAAAKDGFPQQIIVKYKDSALVSKKQETAIGDKLRAIGARRGMLLQRMRTMGTGAEVIRVDRDLDARDLADVLAEFKSDRASSTPRKTSSSSRS